MFYSVFHNSRAFKCVDANFIFSIKNYVTLARLDVMPRSHRKSRLPPFRAENIFRKSHQRNFGCWSSWLDGTPTGTYVAYTQLVYIGGYSCVYATLHISAHNVAKKKIFSLLMSLSSKSVEKVTILVWNNLHRVVTINGLKQSPFSWIFCLLTFCLEVWHTFRGIQDLWQFVTGGGGQKSSKIVWHNLWTAPKGMWNRNPMHLLWCRLSKYILLCFLDK